jgi:hypothetical protein
MRQIVPARTVALNMFAAYGQIGLLMELVEEGREAGRREDARIAEIDRLVGMILDTFMPLPAQRRVSA